MDCNVERFLWSAKSNRASGISSTIVEGDPVPWISGPGKWARCFEVSKHTPAFRAWTGLMMRTYAAGVALPTYAGARVCEEWHTYQVFAEWYYSQPGYSLGYEVDKDILVPGNKEYSPKACGLVPKWLNKFFAFQYSTNSSGFPGVSVDSKGRLWLARVQCSALKENLSKTAESFESACRLYCEMKESQASRAAEQIANSPVAEKYVEALRHFKVRDYLGMETANEL